MNPNTHISSTYSHVFYKNAAIGLSLWVVEKRNYRVICSCVYKNAAIGPSRIGYV